MLDNTPTNAEPIMTSREQMHTHTNTHTHIHTVAAATVPMPSLTKERTHASNASKHHSITIRVVLFLRGLQRRYFPLVRIGASVCQKQYYIYKTFLSGHK